MEETLATSGDGGNIRDTSKTIHHHTRLTTPENKTVTRGIQREKPQAGGTSGKGYHNRQQRQGGRVVRKMVDKWRPKLMHRYYFHMRQKHSWEGGGNSIGEVRKKGRAETRTGVVSMDHRYSVFPTSM